MMKFVVAIEGEKFEFDTITKAKAKYNELLAQDYWEVVLRLHADNEIYVYNRNANAFFFAYSK